MNRTAEIWNALPPHNAEVCSKASFKLKLSEIDFSVHCRGRGRSAI